MKIRTGFMLRNIADNWIVVPLGERVVDFNGLITLNETGAFLWQKLQAGIETEKLMDVMLEEYDIDKATAEKDVAEFISSLQAAELVDE